MKAASEEMVDGFRDGYDLDAPEPNENRTHSYRHGFKAGRNDKSPYGSGPFHGMSADGIRRLADEAMELDERARDAGR